MQHIRYDIHCYTLYWRERILGEGWLDSRLMMIIRIVRMHRTCFSKLDKDETRSIAR